jgi:hypothetical protein
MQAKGMRRAFTGGVPQAEVDDVAVDGDVGAEVVEHGGDVVLPVKQIGD